MSGYRHSKSGLFLMELLINLLLFCVLCGCGLMFFIKSNNMTEDTTTLHHAVSITSSIASIYESGDGSYTSIREEFEYAALDDKYLYIYFDEEYHPCSETDSVYYVLAEEIDAALDKIRIDFYDSDGEVAYSIRACHYAPTTLGAAKEVALP